MSVAALQAIIYPECPYQIHILCGLHGWFHPQLWDIVLRGFSHQGKWEVLCVCSICFNTGTADLILYTPTGNHHFFNNWVCSDF